MSTARKCEDRFKSKERPSFRTCGRVGGRLYLRPLHFPPHTLHCNRRRLSDKKRVEEGAAAEGEGSEAQLGKGERPVNARVGAAVRLRAEDEGGCEFRRGCLIR